MCEAAFFSYISNITKMKDTEYRVNNTI